MLVFRRVVVGWERWTNVGTSPRWDVRPTMFWMLNIDPQPYQQLPSYLVPLVDEQGLSSRVSQEGKQPCRIQNKHPTNQLVILRNCNLSLLSLISRHFHDIPSIRLSWTWQITRYRSEALKNNLLLASSAKYQSFFNWVCPKMVTPKTGVFPLNNCYQWMVTRYHHVWTNSIIRSARPRRTRNGAPSRSRKSFCMVSKASCDAPTSSTSCAAQCR